MTETARPGLYCSRSCRNRIRLRPLSERFWEKVDRDADCWLWTAYRQKDGYGTLREQGRSVLAHRIAWELVAGPIPDGLWVLHTCDNRACVRNDDAGCYELDGILHPRLGHLWLGTEHDNARDMEAKGRNPKGELSGMAKLTETAVREIKARLARNESLYSIGRAYDVEPTTIGDIREGRTWKHVT